MRESLVKARDRRMYLGHAKRHMARIKLALPRIKARALAQERGDLKESGKTGCIARLKQYERLLEQYEAEEKLYFEMTRNVEPEELMVAHEREAKSEEVDDGGR